MGYNLRRRTPLRRGPKYGSVRTDGYASKLEAAVRGILELREKSGEIRDVKRGRVHLTCGIYWNVDFNFEVVATGARVYAEAKGFETERYQILKKLWAGGFGPGDLEIWKGDYHNPRMVEFIRPKK